MSKYSGTELQNSRFVRNGNEKDRHISCDGLSVAVPSVRTEVCSLTGILLELYELDVLGCTSCEV